MERALLFHSFPKTLNATLRIPKLGGHGAGLFHLEVRLRSLRENGFSLTSSGFVRQTAPLCRATLPPKKSFETMPSSRGGLPLVENTQSLLRAFNPVRSSIHKVVSFENSILVSHYLFLIGSKCSSHGQTIEADRAGAALANEPGSRDQRYFPSNPNDILAQVTKSLSGYLQ